MFLEPELLFSLILIIVTLFSLLIASYTDLKSREVPDWLSYGFLLAVFGVRFLFAFELGWELLINGLLGFLVCLGLACLLYYSHQWGGGDSKLLMGLGAAIGINWPPDPSSFNLLWFLLSLLLFGAIYGFFWLSFLALKRSDEFMEQFRKELGRYKKFHLMMIIVTIFFSVSGFFYFFILPLIFFPLTVFYLFLLVSSVEESCFLKKVPIKQLTSGDWLGQEVLVKGRTFLPKKTLGEEDLIKLRKLEREHLLNEVTIKEGVPFVPSFLLAYLFFLGGASFWSAIFHFI